MQQMKKDDFLTLCQKADSFVVSGHFDQADLIYRDLIANYPKKVAGYVGLARIASKQRNHRLTLNRCDKFIQRFPNDLTLI